MKVLALNSGSNSLMFEALSSEPGGAGANVQGMVELMKRETDIWIEKYLE